MRHFKIVFTGEHGIDSIEIREETPEEAIKEVERRYLFSSVISIEELIEIDIKSLIKEHTCDKLPNEYLIVKFINNWVMETEAGSHVVIDYCPYCGEKL